MLDVSEVIKTRVLCGGIRTSVNDLAKYLVRMLTNQLVDEPRILTQKSTKEMIHDPIFWSNEDNGNKVGHSGGDPGVGTECITILQRT